ncbi:MAG: SUF system NifU family Fe-S cluster assembly protein [Candidatus Aenigmarchaeota archaeon]|nr:SUF system NifU family Fe-S cluster assembly protein [Candidatus Aenigmarchaeota archaeon]MDI6722473.1 SUF system NifU family Fe-S cluster assembly protein [Candidatus Aenigmarchaeota archaeon]
MDIYAENILEHYRHPQNFGTLKHADIEFRDTNPLCGDEIEIQILLEKDRIKDIRFSGKGCAISQASASMLTEMAKWKTLNDILNMSKQDLLDTLGVQFSAVRLKCALLSYKVLKAGVCAHLHVEMEGEE